MQTSFFKLMTLTAFLALASIPALAAKKETPPKRASPYHCGVFEVTGYLKKTGDKHMLVLAPGSRSEALIYLSDSALGDAKHPVLLPATGSFITAKIQMNSPLLHYRGSAQKISDIHLAVPNELRADKGTSLKLIEEKACLLQQM